MNIAQAQLFALSVEDALPIAIDVLIGEKKLSHNKQKSLQKHLPALSRLIADSILGLKNHSVFDGMYEYRRKDLKSLFGSHASFDRLNKVIPDRFHIFLSYDSYSTGTYSNYGFGKGWTINSCVIDELSRIIVGSQYVDITKINQCSSYYSPSAELITFIEPNIASLESFYRDMTYFPNERLKAYALAQCSHVNGGRIPQFYKTSENTARKYTYGPNSYQTLPKRLRNVALEGYFEIDISNCAYTVLLGEAKNTADYPHIKAYVDAPQVLREELASDCGCTIKDVKAAFLHKSNGSSLGFQTSISKSLSKEALSAIKSHPFFVAFTTEYKTLTDEMCQTYPAKLQYFKNRRTKTNKNGDIIGKFKAPFMCWVYQESEAKIAQLILDMTNDPTDGLILHDAVFTKTDLDINEVQKTIKQKLSLDVKLTKE